MYQIRDKLADGGAGLAALFREVDSFGDRGDEADELFRGYLGNHKSCGYQCKRALVLPGQIYVHELPELVPTELSRYTWVVNGVTRNKWSNGVDRDLLMECLVWTLKWARRNSASVLEFARSPGSSEVGGDLLLESFDEAKRQNEEWKLKLVIGEISASGIRLGQRQGFGEIRGVENVFSPGGAV